MNTSNPLCKLFQIKYPIIQGGMVWVSGAKLAAAVSNAGGLGLIGAGSMKPDLLKEHILKAKNLTNKPFGINVPLLYQGAEDQIQCALDLGVRIFFTSAGSPNKMTGILKNHNAIVVHVTSTPQLAQKCENAGVDAVVCEGLEAGGHNGRDEISSMVLIPQVRSQIKIPLIAAGGFSTGRSILSAMALGADGVQMGTRFLMSKESSAHENFKNYALNAKADSTKLLMKRTVPVRLLENEFSKEIESIEANYTNDELKNRLQNHLGKFRARDGMLLGDINQGELEIGQIISQIRSVISVQEIMDELIQDYENTYKTLSSKL